MYTNKDAVIRELVYENAQLRARLSDTIEIYEAEIEGLNEKLSHLMGEIDKSHWALWGAFSSAVSVALKERNE